MAKDLTKYDFIIAIDKSGSMSTMGMHNQSRWKNAKEVTIAVATKAAEFDDDGITVIPFANTLKIYDNVTPAKVEQIFIENEPNGGTDTAGMLQAVFDRYSQSRLPKPIILVVVTDGEPNDKQHVKTVIEKFSNTLRNDDDFGILFLQIGNDPEARKFLKELDDGLKCKFDIVNTKTTDELEGMSLVDAFISALED
ncbi:MAG: VWA domain-containing protein [Pseudomonadota bacterium]|nr:VWA domain-containing protein [Pseudomonadota bacterium]